MMGKYDKIPNYIIKKNGDIIKLLDNTEYSEFLPIKGVNKTGIFINIENLGWLEKETLKNHYVNWIGDIYKGKPFERKWRDYFYWDPYTENQFESLSFLCKKLFEEENIENNIIGHNTKISGADKYKGVLTKSNFDSDFTDVSPSFDFTKLENKIYHE
jgi:N-acetyl-anhydromuramyl-L-alanine amidase AmpD